MTHQIPEGPIQRGEFLRLNPEYIKYPEFIANYGLKFMLFVWISVIALMIAFVTLFTEVKHNQNNILVYTYCACFFVFFMVGACGFMILLSNILFVKRPAQVRFEEMV